MDYNPIVKYLDKFKILLSTNDEIYNAIIQTVNQKTGSTITIKNIKISGSTIHLQTSPMHKSQVLIHKASILSDLSKLLPAKRFDDIR
jgi:hypothetical protein